jgi:hypothetical protein
MANPEANKLCAATVRVASSLRVSVAFRANLPELLDQFWRLQDTVAQLVELANDSPREVFQALRRDYPELVREVVGALEVPAKRPLANIAAISKSCAAINDSLLELEYLKHGRPVAASE